MRPAAITSLDILHPGCDSIDCTQEAKCEREIKVCHRLGQSFTLTAFFCEIHNKEAKTPWEVR
jgi:hypothetical protein